MAPATRRQAPRRRKVYQDSPFLNLPGEIRELIYIAALTRPEPIDLCPREIVTFPLLADATSRMDLRLAKFRKTEPRLYITPRYRDQRDLEYVRKEMATGLLATCQQVCNEARAIFWSTNVWRFSGDNEWRIFRRWLVTIGPQAMSLVKCLEVCAPIDRLFAWAAVEELEDLYWEAKNEPKLHMSKIPRKNVGLVENVDHVSFILQQLEGKKLNIKLMAPSALELNTERSCLPALYIPDSLRAFTNRSLVVAKRAVIWGETIPKKTAEQWEMDVVLEEGCFWRWYFEPRDTDLVTERRKWSPQGNEEFTYLGVVELFENDEKEVFELPARGGKANKSSGRRNVARVLKGFGGCRFVNKEIGECWSCGVRAPYKVGVWKRRSIGWSMFDPCSRCNYRSGQMRITAMEIKNKARAIKMGFVEST